MQALVADLREQARRGIAQAAAAQARERSITARGKLLPRERVDARCSIPARRSSSSRSSRRTACTATRFPPAGIITGIGRVSGPRMRDRRQRRHGQGRHLLSR